MHSFIYVEVHGRSPIEYLQDLYEKHKDHEELAMLPYKETIEAAEVGLKGLKGVIEKTKALGVPCSVEAQKTMVTEAVENFTKSHSSVNDYI